MNARRFFRFALRPLRAFGAPWRSRPFPSVTRAPGQGRVLIVNAYSTLNRGDAVILDGLIASVRNAGATSIVVAAPTGIGEMSRRRALGADSVVPMPLVDDLLQAPGWMRRMYPLLAARMAWRLVAFAVRATVAPESSPALRAYLESDLVISTGGAYLGGRRPGINLLTGFQIMLARSLGRECLIAPVTVKPMSFIVAKVLSVALRGTTIFTRDAPTLDRLRQVGLGARLASDLAFRSPSAARAAAEPRAEHEGLVIAWAPRQFGSDSDAHRARGAIEVAAMAALTSLVRKHDARLLLITQSNAEGIENDLAVIERVRVHLAADVRSRTVSLPPAADIGESIAQYARADVLYGFRLHAAILALMAGTPSLVVAYEAKVTGVLEQVGLADWVIEPAEAMDASVVVKRLLSLAESQVARRIKAARRAADIAHVPFEDELRRRLATPVEAGRSSHGAVIMPSTHSPQRLGR